MRGSKAPIEIDSDRQNFDVFPDESSDLPNVDRFHNMDPHYIAGQYDPGKGKGKGGDRNPAQDKKLTPGEIKRLKDAGWDHSDKSANGKGGGQLDLWKDKDGNVYEKPKNGKGPGDPTGYNLNHLDPIKTIDNGSSFPRFNAPPPPNAGTTTGIGLTGTIIIMILLLPVGL